MMQKQIKNIFLFLALFSVVSLVSFKVGKTVGLEAAGGNQKTEALDLSLMWKVKRKTRG